MSGKIRLLVALGCCLLAAPAAAGLVYPPDGHLAPEEELTVMVFVGAKDPGTIILKGENGDDIKGGLTPGFNLWEVTLPQGRSTLQWGQEKRQLFHMPGAGEGAEGFTPHHLHDAMDDCTNCHQDDSTELKGEIPGLCYECHDDQTKNDAGPRKSVHSPVADGDCSSCHPPHFSSKPKLLDLAVPALCSECHDDMTQNEGKPWNCQHEPVQAGDCLDCHLAHAADEPSLGQAAGVKLCSNCHDDPTAGDNGPKKTIHEPLSSGECDSCHQVHGSKAPTLLTASPEELCAECHDLPFANDAGEAFSVPHEPVDAKECLSCHEPHASDFEGMTLKEGPALCLECHDDPRPDAEGKTQAVVHAALDDGCVPCHAPHGSDSDALVLAPGATLCVECHEDVRLDGEGYSYEFLHRPVEEEKCTACHNPHAAPQENLLPAKGKAFCMTCHKFYHANHRNPYGETTQVQTEVPEDFPVETFPKPENGPRPPAELACEGCHEAHGSAYGSLHKGDQMEFCSRCHRL